MDLIRQEARLAGPIPVPSSDSSSPSIRNIAQGGRSVNNSQGEKIDIRGEGDEIVNLSLLSL